MIREVKVIFKTHLDIGFTDYSKTVIRNYLERFIPKAIETAYQQRETPYQFRWTTGSWLIAEALEHDGKYEVERAIRDGLIEWHALPFTTHSEYMNEALFRYGLSVSQELDRQFHKKTIAAKMTDVPGHTIGIVPLLHEAGVEVLHIGVNPATPVPEVPAMFRWVCGDHAVNVVYSGDYGDVYEIGDTAVAFAMTGDNHGPQGGEPLKSLYEALMERYPEASVTAGSLNDLALLLRGQALPTVTAEIGDSWIHGIGTDPVKTRIYREVLRKEAVFTGHEWQKHLLLIPEHTMGMDLKTFFHNTTDYTPDDLQNAENKETIEASWAEQRNYAVDAASEAKIDVHSLISCEIPDLTGFTPIEEEPPIGFSYQLFDRSDYEHYRKSYLRLDVEWSRWDFLKLGLPEYRGDIYNASVTGSWEKDGERIFRMEFPKEIRDFSKLPTGWLIQKDNKMELRFIGKGNNRLPEAFWIKFKHMEEAWELQKLGQWIDPNNVIGNPWLHAISAVRNHDVVITPLDSMLAAPFGPHMLRWGDKPGEQNLWFNLYNNIWNTNFPMWFSDNVGFRFTVDKSK